MIRTIDRDRTQKESINEPNFWFYNNYARLNEINNQRVECWGTIWIGIIFKDSKLNATIDNYSKSSLKISRGLVDAKNPFNKNEFNKFPYDWVHNDFALNVIYCHFEDQEIIENPHKYETIVTIKPYIKNSVSSVIFYPPKLEEVAKRKIKDLWFDRENDKECIKNFFSFHLEKYDGSPLDFIKNAMSMMLKLCMKDTYENNILMKEFRTWAEEKESELDLRLNIFSKQNGIGTTKTTATTATQADKAVKELFDTVYNDFANKYLSGTQIDIGSFLDSFYDKLGVVLKSASLVSTELKLETLRNVKSKVNISLSKAIKIIDGERIGMYKQDRYEPPLPNENNTSIENFTQKMAYDLKYNKDPFLVAKSNINIYQEIINTLNKDEELIFDELKNTKIEPSDQAEGNATGVQPPPSKDKAVKGYDLGLTIAQLETLHAELMNKGFLRRKTEFEHFKNAFNGEVLKNDFKPLEWIKVYHASIFITHYIDHKTPWLIAETVFHNVKVSSLKTSYKKDDNLISNEKIKCVQSLDGIMKSLQ